MESILVRAGIGAFLLIICIVLYGAKRLIKGLMVGGISRDEKYSSIAGLVVLALSAVVAVAGVCLLLGLI